MEPYNVKAWLIPEFFLSFKHYMKCRKFFKYTWLRLLCETLFIFSQPRGLVKEIFPEKNFDKKSVKKVASMEN